MEKMSEREEKRLNALREKLRRIQREEKAFWREVDARKEEVLMHFNIEGDMRPLTPTE